MARKAKSIEASEQQKIALLTMKRSLKIEKRYSQRAEVILLSIEGKTLEEIIEETGLSRPAINKWRQRFRAKGVEGLRDAPRSGKPTVITAEQKALVIQKACEKPEGGYTNWSQKRIGKIVGISQSKVHKILSQAELKPHKIEYWCGKSPDPDLNLRWSISLGFI